MAKAKQTPQTPTSEQMTKKALEVAKTNELLFVEDVAAYMGISKTTLYKYMPVGLNDMNALKAVLNANQINMKVHLRRQWLTAGNATTQIALYKLLATPDEFTRLSSQRIELTDDAAGNAIANDTKIQTKELPENLRTALFDATILSGDTMTVDYSLLSDKDLDELVKVLESQGLRDGRQPR